MWIRKLQDIVQRMVEGDDGVTATEYAVCLAMLVLGTILAITALGTNVSALFPDLASLI